VRAAEAVDGEPIPAAADPVSTHFALSPWPGNGRLLNNMHGRSKLAARCRGSGARRDSERSVCLRPTSSRSTSSKTTRRVRTREPRSRIRRGLYPRRKVLPLAADAIATGAGLRTAGRVQGVREMVLSQLAERFGELPVRTQRRGRGASEAELARLAKRVISARTLSEALKPVASKQR